MVSYVIWEKYLLYSKIYFIFICLCNILPCLYLYFIIFNHTVTQQLQCPSWRQSKSKANSTPFSHSKINQWTWSYFIMFLNIRHIVKNLYKGLLTNVASDAYIHQFIFFFLQFRIKKNIIHQIVSILGNYLLQC